MRARILVAAAGAAALASLHVGPAQAASGPETLRPLAQAQTQLLLSHLTTPVGVQVASPTTCNVGQPPEGTGGTFLLPTRSGGSGDQTFTCNVRARSVLLDLGGAFVTEDARANKPWVTATGQELPFTRGNLEAICDDVLPRFFPGALPATLDGLPLTGGMAVSTAPFTSIINKSTGKLYGDSVIVGHPGTLATTYCGWKALVPLSNGDHTITVEFTDPKAGAFTFTYNIAVSA